jgi:glyoxylate carboligase
MTQGSQETGQALAPPAPTEAGRGPARHGGAAAVAAARRHGVTTMFTLSGGHVFPLYDRAVKADPALALVDVRHKQTAVFAAEATARLTRCPGLAVLTAGPGVTNGVSAVTTAPPIRPLTRQPDRHRDHVLADVHRRAPLIQNLHAASLPAS